MADTEIRYLIVYFDHCHNSGWHRHRSFDSLDSANQMCEHLNKQFGSWTTYKVVDPASFNK